VAKKPGRFIVLEGPDKCGKSTQAGLLVRALIEHGRQVVHTREPGGKEVDFAEAIRKLLLDPRHDVDPVAELLLYEAARAQHVQKLVLPAVTKGAVVVCERFTLATLAYQGHARGLAMPMVRKLNRIATGGFNPDLTLVLDIPDREFRRRAPDREYDRLELESSIFRRKVAKAYRKLAGSEPKTALVDADRDPSVVHVDIVERISLLLKAAVKPVPYAL